MAKQVEPQWTEIVVRLDGGKTIFLTFPMSPRIGEWIERDGQFYEITRITWECQDQEEGDKLEFVVPVVEAKNVSAK